jgi:hypothetical protein
MTDRVMPDDVGPPNSSKIHKQKPELNAFVLDRCQYDQQKKELDRKVQKVVKAIVERNMQRLQRTSSCARHARYCEALELARHTVYSIDTINLKMKAYLMTFLSRHLPAILLGIAMALATEINIYCIDFGIEKCN